MEKMPVSCGAFLCTHNKEGQFGLILGREKSHYLPFKGCSHEGEKDVDTASRELYEETCGLVFIPPEDIKLLHIFETKRKEYRIGLVYVNYDIIEKFHELYKAEDRVEYMEKDSLKFFPFDNNILKSYEIHNITKASIRYYWNNLVSLKYHKPVVNGRKQSVSEHFANEYYVSHHVNNKQEHEREPKKRKYAVENKTRAINKNRDLDSFWRNNVALK